MEAVDPTVRAILDDTVIRDDGVQFVDNYAAWIMHLRTRSRRENSRVFVQLAVLARQFLEADCKPVAVSLATLARIGLPRLKLQGTTPVNSQGARAGRTMSGSSAEPRDRSLEQMQPRPETPA